MTTTVGPAVCTTSVGTTADAGWSSLLTHGRRPQNTEEAEPRPGLAEKGRKADLHKF